MHSFHHNVAKVLTNSNDVSISAILVMLNHSVIDVRVEAYNQDYLNLTYHQAYGNICNDNIGIIQSL